MHCLIMVNSYVAIDYATKVKASPGIPFHRFPLKNPQLFQKQIQALKMKVWVPIKYSYICNEHFEPSCFVVR